MWARTTLFGLSEKDGSCGRRAWHNAIPQARRTTLKKAHFACRPLLPAQRRLPSETATASALQSQDADVPEIKEAAGLLGRQR